MQYFSGWLNSLKESKSDAICLIAHNMPGCDGPMLQSLLNCYTHLNLSYIDSLSTAKRRIATNPMPRSYGFEQLRKHYGLAPLPGPYSDAFEHAKGLEELIDEICYRQNISAESFFFG